VTAIRSSSNPDCNQQRRSRRQRSRLAKTTSGDRGWLRRFDNRRRRDVTGQTPLSAIPTWSTSWSWKPSTSVEGAVNRTDDLTMDSNLTDSKSHRLRLVVVVMMTVVYQWGDLLVDLTTVQVNQGLCHVVLWKPTTDDDQIVGLETQSCVFQQTDHTEDIHDAARSWIIWPPRNKNKVCFHWAQYVSVFEQSGTLFHKQIYLICQHNNF